MDNTTNDRTTVSMHKGIMWLFDEIISKNDVIPSQAVIHAFIDEEGMDTSFIPAILYHTIKFGETVELVKYAKIPRLFCSGDEALDREFMGKCEADGFTEAQIDKIIASTPNERKCQEEQLDAYMSSPNFKLEEGETIDQVRKDLTPPYFPLVIFKDEAIPTCGPRITISKSLRGAEIRTIRASMPPHHLDGPLYGAYIEKCTRIVCSGMRVTDSSKIYFSFRVIADENMIVFYICTLHAKESQ